MAKRRFRLLERTPGAGAPPAGSGADGARDAAEAGTAPGAAHEGDVAGARARRLEREGTLRLDESGPFDTDFCRHCRFENRGGAARCLHCGSPLGSADQEGFDDEMRAQREQRRRVAAASGGAGAAAPARATRPVDPSPPSLADLDVERLLREAERHAPGFGTVIAAGVLVGCIFALVSIPLRWIFSSVHGGFSGGGVIELVLLVALTAGIYAVVRRPLARL